MKEKVLIVEDQSIEALNLQRILQKGGYGVCGKARSVEQAIELVQEHHPNLVLLDIFLKGPLTGIDLAYVLKERNIAFIYLSANSNQETLNAAKATDPYGFLVKPVREKDVLVMLEIAQYKHLQQFTRGSKGISVHTTEKKLPLSTSSPLSNTVANIHEDPFMGIVGNSGLLKETLRQMQIVAPTDTTVLILGESGTGKERIAECIHYLSPRRHQPLIKVNCGALPSTLIESILFGHEAGAFTGATTRNIGKFEQADKGTLFLDEVAELSLEMQTKLLRALQENEIERLGGKTTIKLNVRILSATNRNLEKEVAEGRFRLDLYYRLNVFPLHLPALHQRREDIPLLITHFLQKFCNKFGRTMLQMSSQLIHQLQQYNWPGNIRELEHLIERAVLLTTGDTIHHIDLPVIRTMVSKDSSSGSEMVKTIDEMEKEHILNILGFCKGKISGAQGAATLLGVPPSTLHSKMKRLGIQRKYSE